MSVIRLATARDIKTLRDLCRAAVGPDDYVLGYLPEMIRERATVVAAEAGRIVAMAGVTECADRALWIGQMRTHPAFRRRGFARLLLQDAYDRARRERRPALRLWTSERNAGGRALFEGTGFREVGRYTRVQAQASPAASGPRVSRYAGRAYTSWMRSAVRRACGGYIAYQWHFLPLGRALLAAMARRGELLEEDDGAILMWVEPEDPVAYVTVLAGGRRALEAARRAAAMQGRRTVEVFLPRSRRILQWARAAGYAPAPWGRHAVLYERPVRGGGVVG